MNEPLDVKVIRAEWDDARGEGFQEMQNCAFEYFPTCLDVIEQMDNAVQEVSSILGYARAHDCAGWDCATCQPSIMQDRLRAALALVKR